MQTWPRRSRAPGIPCWRIGTIPWSTVEGDSELAPPLLALAQRSFDIGEAIWAHAVAREAACHAEPELQPQAHLIAAETALHAGYLNDAQKWLSGAALASDPAAGQADPTPQQGSGASSTADWLRELDDQRVPLWLTEISSSDFANSGQRPDAAAMQQLQRHRGRILKAFQLCEEDDFDAALAQLAQPLAAASASASATPLLRSLRRTARALVLTWAGRFPEALTSLQDALFNGPGELVLGGIAGELSARLELLTSGEPSALSNSLFRLPGSHRDPVELLLDRSMNARFEGHAQEAAAFLDVASGHASGDDPGTEPSSQRRSFFLPSASAADPVLNGIGRSLRQLALTKLRYQITADRQLPEEQLESLASELNTLGRPPASSFDRGLAELELGLAFAHREPAPAPNGGDKRLVHVRRHLIAAGNSFENCGSSAWQRIAEQELADINAALDIPRVSVPRPTGIPATSFPPTLETARAEASAVTPSPVSPESADHRPDPFAGLTEREAEVAAFVAAGLPNREVAQKLHLSVRTVEVHLSRVFTKLGLRSRVELSILAHRITDEH
ncbi:helix-turn-helix transcriptional regulator [Acaricomes phytoseiuli]|uniref:helix-turn-helix transcriptional regulator n=1 Tax=Acaricomes phytoseiuli TaxID=291968 RepID=UPI00036A47C5|nr:helix-turn-helix transcriptional regulator [Acaricomes phytoseiuli]